MKKFFNSVLNVLIRDLPFAVRIGISVVLFFVALFALYKTLRKKNDTHPIAIGWLILFVVCIFLSIVYITL